MYKKNIENVFEIGSHKIETEFFELDKLSERESKILNNAIKSGVIEVVEEVKEETEVKATTVKRTRTTTAKKVAE